MQTIRFTRFSWKITYLTYVSLDYSSLEEKEFWNNSNKKFCFFFDSGRAHRIARNLASFIFSPSSSESHYLGLFHASTCSHSCSFNVNPTESYSPPSAKYRDAPCLYQEKNWEIGRNLWRRCHASWMAVSGLFSTNAVVLVNKIKNKN